MSLLSTSNSVIFVATIFDNNTMKDTSSSRHIQSEMIAIEPTRGSQRYHDVPQSKIRHFDYVRMY